MFIPLKVPSNDSMEYLLNVDHILCVINTGSGAELELSLGGEYRFVTSTPYEEVKKMLLDGQGTEIRVEVEERPPKEGSNGKVH